MLVTSVPHLQVAVWSDGSLPTALPRDATDRGGTRLSFEFPATHGELLLAGRSEAVSVLVVHAGPATALELLRDLARGGALRGDQPAVVLACGDVADLPVAALLAAGVHEICTGDAVPQLLDAVLVARERARRTPPTRCIAEEAVVELSADYLRFALDGANAGVWSFDLVTGTLTWSEGIYRITGFDPARGPPSLEDWSARVHPDDLPQLLRVKEGSASGPFETVSLQFRFYPTPGDERWILTQGRLERGADGQPLRYAGLDIDVTALRRGEQAGEQANRRLEESYALLDTVFDCAPVGLTFLDREYRYVRINQTLASLNGVPVEAHLGRSIAEVLPSVWPSVKPLLDQVRDTGVPISDVLVRAPVPGRPAGPEENWWLAGYFPIRVRGELFGFGIVAQDVTVQTNAEHMLRRADERKDRFLATLAHELRNPLAPIRNAVAILRRLQGKGDPAPLIAMIERQVVHMVRLVDDLLEVSRISRDKLELRREHFDLRGVVPAALEISNPLITEMGHRLHVDMAAMPVEVHGDRVRLVQVTSNLLNNAAKYTPAGGRIDLTVAVEAGEALITVEDNGIGILAQSLQDIFEVFSQAEALPAVVQDGLGIGLWLVRQLVTLHGGRVDAYSAGEGSGSRFVVRLPLATPG